MRKDRSLSAPVPEKRCRKTVHGKHSAETDFIGPEPDPVQRFGTLFQDEEFQAVLQSFFKGEGEGGQRIASENQKIDSIQIAFAGNGFGVEAETMEQRSCCSFRIKKSECGTERDTFFRKDRKGEGIFFG